MHLPVAAKQLSVGVDDDRGVVVDAGGAAFEQRRDEDDLLFARGLGQRLGRRSGDRLGQIEVGVVFALAEVLAAKQLGQADHRRAAVRRLDDARAGASQVVVGIGRAAHLHEADLENLRGRHGAPTIA